MHLFSQATESAAVIISSREIMYKKSWLTYPCDVVCWIPTSPVHTFKWVNSCFKSCHPWWQVNTWTYPSVISLKTVVSQFLFTKVSPEWRLNWGFGTQKKCPFPLNRGVPSLEVTNTKIMWTFFRDQILYSLNGRVPKERFHCSVVHNF